MKFKTKGSELRNTETVDVDHRILGTLQHLDLGAQAFQASLNAPDKGLFLSDRKQRYERNQDATSSKGHRY